jgi:hypothetical protein
VFNLRKVFHPVMTRELIDYLLMSIPTPFIVRKMKRVLRVLLRYLGERSANREAAVACMEGIVEIDCGRIGRVAASSREKQKTRRSCVVVATDCDRVELFYVWAATLLTVRRSLPWHLRWTCHPYR